MQKKKLYINTMTALIYQICSVVIGLILPRLILKAFGSEVNGLTNSISQMLSIITLLDLGVGAVVQAALYRPLFERDDNIISIIYSSANKFFSLIAKILVIYIGILCLFYGIFKTGTYGWMYTVSLIIAIAISYFAQYYFGICNILLLNADQKVYIVTLVNLVGLLVNAGITIILLNVSASIQIVKLVSSIIYLIRPLALQVYVKKYYKIKLIKNPPKDAIPNKWSGLAQHIAVVVTNTVDNVVLTMFTTFSQVSIYNVYVMPLNSIKSLIEATSVSYKAFFGELIVKDNKDVLIKEFRFYETLMHFVVVVIYGTIMKVLVSFVLLYTSGVTDAEYKNVMFGILITIAYASYTIRLPYSNIIFAAGKFKETQIYSIIECIINIVISVALVNIYGLCGVAIGTVLSSGYRTIASAYYLKKDILMYKLKYFWKHLLVDVCCVGIFLSITNVIKMDIHNFAIWFVWSLLLFILNICISGLLFSIFYRDHFNLIDIVKLIIKKVRG